MITALASIVGTSELYVRTGSTISLTCIIQGSGSIPPRVLFWFHNSKPIALDSPRGGISLETERTVTGMSSKLLLTRAALQDGGNYTCAPPGAQPADVTVHKWFSLKIGDLKWDYFVMGGIGYVYAQVSIRQPCNEGTGVRRPMGQKGLPIWVPNACGPFNIPSSAGFLAIRLRLQPLEMIGTSDTLGPRLYYIVYDECRRHLG
ncbi:hypothetical protein OUZ56_022806 [Daphnia magna]|uniref:Ig-like domain-containing protein n=1 Tax=Daphnia magna TaxID=35525 RepID=A0ABR0AXI7_9CRUS|nr:hypothetical protein OUZ56_022806 [Daphnia magna]